MTMTIVEAQPKLAELANRARAGEEIILVSDDEQALAIRLQVVSKPVPAHTQRRLGTLYNPAFKLPDDFFDPLPEEELRLWEGEGE